MTPIKLKTNYNTKEELLESLSKKIGRSKIFYNYQSRLWTEIKPDHTLVLTSDGKRLGSFEFIGEIIEEDGICLKGFVQKRKDILFRQKSYSVMMLIIALLMFTTINVVFIFMGILFILVTFLNLTFFKDEKPFIKFLEKNLES